MTGFQARYLDHGKDDMAPHVGVVGVDLSADRLQSFETLLLKISGLVKVRNSANTSITETLFSMKGAFFYPELG